MYNIYYKMWNKYAIKTLTKADKKLCWVHVKFLYSLVDIFSYI